MPIEVDLGRGGDTKKSVSDSEEEMESYIEKLHKVRNNLFEGAQRSIKESQKQQKQHYDKRHAKIKVSNISISTIYILHVCTQNFCGCQF